MMNPYTTGNGQNDGGHHSEMESDDEWPDDGKGSGRKGSGKGKGVEGDGGEGKEKKGINRVNRACVRILLGLA